MRVPTKPLSIADISPVVEANFWSRVQFDWRPGACWLWLGGAEGDAHRGRIKLDDGRRAQANRVAYVLTQGSLGSDEFACHTCDNPKCVRPDHLFAGTATDNMVDKLTKGRQARGSRTGTAILNEAQVAAIKADTRSQYVLGRAYGVSRHTIGKIKQGINWRHVEAAL